jgi:hypothetical protein
VLAVLISRVYCMYIYLLEVADILVRQVRTGIGPFPLSGQKFGHTV